MTKKSVASQLPRLPLVLVSEGPQPLLSVVYCAQWLSHEHIGQSLRTSHLPMINLCKAQTMAYGRYQMLFANVGQCMHVTASQQLLWTQ